MEVRFWGVRGSIATPGSDTGYFGGNTSCVEIRDAERCLIFDAGTGLRPLGHSIVRRRKRQRELHLFLSHFHLDHLAGLPFFRPLYQKDFTLHLYGPKGYGKSLRQIIATLFKQEYFPVPLSELPAKLRLHSLGEQATRVTPFRVTSFYLNHPGQTLGYVAAAHKHRVAYVTDHEPIREVCHIPKRQRLQYEQNLLKQLEDVDIMIHDAQYTDRLYAKHRGWGHSPWTYPIRLAEEAGIRKLVLYHHDPDQSDRTLKREFARLKRSQGRQNPQLYLAREGEVMTL